MEVSDGGRPVGRGTKQGVRPCPACIAQSFSPPDEGAFMNNLNSVLIEGNLVKDPERFDFNTGTMAKFSIGVNRYYRNAAKEPMKETSFITVQTWGALAEGCCRYLKKGRGVRVVGRLKQEKWTDDKIVRDRHVIVAEHVEFKPEPKEQAEPVRRSDAIGSDTAQHCPGVGEVLAPAESEASESIVLEQTQDVNDVLSALELSQGVDESSAEF